MQFMTKGQESAPMTSIAPASAAVTASDPAADAAGPRRAAASAARVNLRQSGIYIAFALIVVLFTILTDGALLQPQNISNIIVQNSYILILAIGMILVIIAGHIDLSAGSVVAVTGAISAVLMVNLDVPWPLAVLVTLGRGRADRRLAGLLDRLRRHPGVHRHAGRHAAVPRAHARPCSATRASARSPTPVRTLSNGFVDGLPRQRRARPARRRRPVHAAGRRWRRWPAIVAHAVARPRGPARLRPGRRAVPAVRRQDRRRRRSW